VVQLHLCFRGLCCGGTKYVPTITALMLATYIPVTLEQLASEKGVLFSDLTTPCSQQSGQALFRRFANGDRCVFRIFGLWVDTASFALYVFSISVLLQALVVISMSGAADHGFFCNNTKVLMLGNHRKNLLLGFAVVGSIASMLFAAVGTGGAMWAGLCAIIGNVFSVWAVSDGRLHLERALCV